MSARFKEGDPVIHVNTRKKGVITEVNIYWGWFVVEYENGYRKRYEDPAIYHHNTIMHDLDALTNG